MANLKYVGVWAQVRLVGAIKVYQCHQRPDTYQK